MADNATLIANFLRSKGLSSAAVAGIIGNLMVESSLNPSAINQNEGAIGIAQWEGGRRTALQNWAADMDGSPYDLNIQLSFLWHELTTSESGALSAIKSAGSAASAAAIWDEQYERSAGTTRNQRIAYAEQFAAGQPLTGASGSGGSVNDGTPANMSLSDYESIDSLGSLLKTVPELKNLVSQALAHNWSSTKFQDSVENSTWYKTHSQTVRSVLIQKANDPASYKAELQNAYSTVSLLSKQLGFVLSGSQGMAIAANALLTGNASNQQWLSYQIGHNVNYGKLTSLDGLRGQMAQTVQQLQSMAADYGYTYSTPGVASHAQQIVMGNQTIDTYRQQLIDWAKSTFPSLAKQIDSGSTVKDLANPYVQSMANILELDPASLTVYTPQIRKALQGTQDPKTQDFTATPIWQFEQQMRSDPRWQFTSNAKDTISSALVHIGRDFGFGF